jgi:selenide,water dikinase
MALALVGMPIDKLPIETIGKILAGGESICAEAGIPVAGGHTIDSVEPIYGLVVMGLIHPDRIKRNSHAKAGDKLILGKPLGVGILSAALKKGALDAQGYAAMIASTTQLNTPGKDLSAVEGVHAITDVTGFGLLGHAREMALGANLSARINVSSVPYLPNVEKLAAEGFITGASGRNWAGYSKDIQLSSSISDVTQALLCDPQTSGGLLVACSDSAVEKVMQTFHHHGFAHAAVIGDLQQGTAGVQVI